MELDSRPSAILRATVNTAIFADHVRSSAYAVVAHFCNQASIMAATSRRHNPLRWRRIRLRKKNLSIGMLRFCRNLNNEILLLLLHHLYQGFTNNIKDILQIIPLITCLLLVNLSSVHDASTSFVISVLLDKCYFTAVIGVLCWIFTPFRRSLINYVI